MEFLPAEAKGRCLGLFGLSLLLLTAGIGYLVVFGTALAEYIVILSGLFVGWVAFLYCFAHLAGWRE